MDDKVKSTLEDMLEAKYSYEDSFEAVSGMPLSVALWNTPIISKEKMNTCVASIAGGKTKISVKKGIIIDLKQRLVAISQDKFKRRDQDLKLTFVHSGTHS